MLARSLQRSRAVINLTDKIMRVIKNKIYTHVIAYDILTESNGEEGQTALP